MGREALTMGKYRSNLAQALRALLAHLDQAAALLKVVHAQR